MFEDLRPPVQKFGTLQWEVPEQIEQTGYEYGAQIVAQWLAEKVVLFLGVFCPDDITEVPMFASTPALAAVG